MRRLRGSGTVYFHQTRQIWCAELTWNGKRHYRQASSRYEAHVALMELRQQRDRETGR